MLDTTSIKWMVGSHGLPECYYKLKVPSVSAILSLIPDPEFEEWVRKSGKEKVDEIMKQAGYRGTAMHTFIQNFLNTYAKTKDVSKSLKDTQEQSPLLIEKENVPLNKINEGRDLFYKFYYSEFPTKYVDLIATEMGLYSSSLYYRGKLDVFYKDRLFGPAITDFKTSNGFIKKDSIKEYKYKCQLAGYTIAIEEMYAERKLEIKRTSILCVNTKDDGLQEIECSGSELQKYKEIFSQLAKDWHIQNISGMLV